MINPPWNNPPVLYGQVFTPEQPFILNSTIGITGGGVVAATGGLGVSGVLDIQVSYRHRSMRGCLTFGGEGSVGGELTNSIVGFVIPMPDSP